VSETEAVYPKELGPPGKKRIDLPDIGRSILVTSFRPRFEPWSLRRHGPVPLKKNARGESVPDDYGGKPFVRVGNRPLFPELAIVKIFQQAGWDGVWVYTASGSLCNDWPLKIGRVDALPGAPRSLGEKAEPGSPAENLGMFDYLYEKSLKNRGLPYGGGGRPDAFVWKDENFHFIECKDARRNEDLTLYQKRWIQAMVEYGLPDEWVAQKVWVVEWIP
jgi:hypothetical protein